MGKLYLDYEGIKKTHGKEIADAFDEMQEIFTDGLVDWFANLWDDKIGAFYYSVSARDHEGFLPDIESTAQAMGHLATAGMFEEGAAPFDMDKKAALFAKALQDPDGYFYHPQWGKNIGTSRRGRDLGNALGLISAGGEKPAYVDANTRIREAVSEPKQENSDIIPEHLRSKEVFLEYLEGLDINHRSYHAGHTIGAQAAQIEAAGMTDVAVDFLNSTQKENGLWEDKLTYYSSNGLMKISCAYRFLKRRMPNLDKAFDASLELALADISLAGEGITSIYNTFYTIENVLLALEETGDTELIENAKQRMLAVAPDMIRMTTKKLKTYLRPDGSYSYAPYSSAITSQGARASLGAYEGDVNAVMLAMGSRRRCGKLLGVENFQILYTEEHRKRFLDIIKANAKKDNFPKIKSLKVQDLPSIREEWGDEVADVTESMHTVFTEGLIRWIASMWDKDRGGFYYSVSARDNDEFLPDIESTAQALGHMEMLGLVDKIIELPEQMKNKIVSFLQGLQDPEDGYFYHPQWGKDINSSRRGRDLTNAIGILSDLGAKPLYPTALDKLAEMSSGESVDKSVLAENLRSEEAFRKYLADFDINSDCYKKGHILGAQAAEIKAAGFADICKEYLDSTQLENGMWEENETYHAANGLLKISGCYLGIGKEFPNLEKALMAAIRIAMKTSPATCLVEVYNPICTVQNLFENVKRSGKTELIEEAREILRKNARSLIKITKEKLAIFKKADDSFSYNYNCSTPYSQAAHVSLGLDEGDMNAVALADSSRARLFKILGIDLGGVCSDELKAEFYSLLGY